MGSYLLFKTLQALLVEGGTICGEKNGRLSFWDMDMGRVISL